MRPMLVVVSAPSSDQDTSLGQARKPMVVQALISESAVEAFDERILRRFACLDQLELHAVLVGPLVQSLAGEFRSLVCPDRLGIAPETRRLIEHPGHVMS